MIQTVEAVIDAEGRVRLVGEVHVTGPRRAFLTVLEEPAAVPGQPALLAEPALADWNRPVIEKIRQLHAQYPNAYPRRCRRCGVEARPPDWD